MLRIIILALEFALLTSSEPPLSVSPEVMNLILGCNRGPSYNLRNKQVLPVFETAINVDSGTTSQQVSLLDMDQLRESLKHSVHSDNVLNYIMGQIEDNFDSSDISVEEEKKASTRSECSTIKNTITIQVPPEEIDEFNDRVQMIMQQNNFMLLEQINTLFSFKLKNFYDNIEKLIKQRSNKLMQSINTLHNKLGDTGESIDEIEEIPTTASPNEEVNEATTVSADESASMDPVSVKETSSKGNNSGQDFVRISQQNMDIRPTDYSGLTRPTYTDSQSGVPASAGPMYPVFISGPQSNPDGEVGPENSRFLSKFNERRRPLAGQN